ncbi:DEAD/DEAH box helicase [Neptunomonas concharum]|uniref:DEAD-box ATP-dependent RNA helicase RhpA n=1 Tax=Neptunomonas concharum TaxID=1031538 RepID=A0A5P1RDQ1_9GAMM|nr:DEAD/DEAH box helicase [Neptunomonas concharum]QEQ97774.1 DEAD/DEAH box helicase [Neptunomonas concharum]
MPSFADFNLCPELQYTLSELGYQEPTPIQTQAIPLVLAGKDVMAEAQTGTGKTASFALPMIERLSKHPAPPEYHPIRGLILTPTRELAIQVADNTLAYGTTLGMRVISIYGGVRFDNQIRKMKRGADILVATPGRLLDMLAQKKLSLEALEILVFDEADRMLDLGFIHDIKKILSYTPDKKQTLLFSATFNEGIEALSDTLLNDPVSLSVTPRNSTTSQVKQRAYGVDNGDKADILSYMIKEGNWSRTLVFTRTKRRADQVADYLQQEGITAMAIHGDKHQKERIAALQAFTDDEIQVLVATDVAARGLDIESLPRVINYDLPNQAEAYVHRIGRTGRAGQKGMAISLVAPDEKRFLVAIVALINKQIPIQAVPTFINGELQDSKSINKQKSKPTQRSKKKTTNKPKKPAPPAVHEEPDMPARPALRRSLFKK